MENVKHNILIKLFVHLIAWCLRVPWDIILAEEEVKWQDRKQKENENLSGGTKSEHWLTVNCILA
jgi:hypothetical protein